MAPIVLLLHAVKLSVVVRNFGCAGVLALVTCTAGCDGDEDCGAEGMVDAGGIEVSIGTPGEDGLTFVPLEVGGEIALATYGQGGTHATVAVRALNLGTNRAFIDVVVENANDGRTVMTVMSSKPMLWLCDDAREVCDNVPIHVMTGGLAAPEEKDGLRVIVTATVRDERGRSGEGSQEGVLIKRFTDRDGGVRADDDAGAEDDAGL